MHATATPGDWQELQNALAEIGPRARISARKGLFGHGMSSCGGWELTALYLGMEKGLLYPVGIRAEELHPAIRPLADRLVLDRPAPVEGDVAGKINMGIGGVNACVIGRRWPQGGGSAAGATPEGTA